MGRSGEEEGAAPIWTAAARDVDAVTATIASAFAQDPLWTWALPDLGARASWWRFLIASALRYPNVHVYGDFEAASVWIPPSSSELTPEEEKAVTPLLERLAGDRAPQIAALLEAFDASHVHTEPHYYLTLLGTRADRRGNGLGTRLLESDLVHIDAERAPAYLESSNPANVARYERLGFSQVGEFSTPDGSHAVATMWRAARAH